jgi:hypothetical protein
MEGLPAASTRRDRRVRLALVLSLVALVAMRTVYLDTPCAGSHGWRQADTLAVARNYVTEEAPFLLPRIDRRGDLTGIGGCEFPALNYGVALGYRVLGLHDWVGRALVLAISVLASLFLYAHVAQRAGPAVGLVAMLLMNGAPVYFYYSRCVMPDTVAVAAMLGSLWAFGRWLASDRSPWLAGSAGAAALALLIKPSTGILLFGFAYCLLRRDGLGVFRQVRLVLWTAAILLPALWWYGVHAPWLNEHYGMGEYFHIRPHTLAGLRELVTTDLAWIVVKKELFGSFVARPALLFFALLAVTAWRRRRGQPLPAPPLARQLDHVLVGWFAGFVVLVLCDARMFRFHEYYGLPIVPAIAIVCALGAGVALRWAGGILARQVLVWGLVVAAVALGAARSYRSFGGGPDPAAIAAVQAVVPADALVITVDDQHSVELYLLHRKGWSLFSDQPLDDVPDWITRGARFVVSKHPTWHSRPDVARMAADWTPVLDERGYRVWRVRGS